MVLQVKWNFSLSVESGPTIAAAGKIDATAYDKISTTIENGKSETVNLQPSETKDINLICITSDQYHINDTQSLTYSFPETTASEEPAGPSEPTAEASAEGIKLDNAHFLVGNALVNRLSKDATQLTFINKTGNDAHVEILIVRKASP
jgi:hypothetical protein